MSYQKIMKVSSDVKTLEVGVNGVASIRFFKHEPGGTAGPFDIYYGIDESGKPCTIEGFFEKDNIKIEHQTVRGERELTLFDFMT